MNKLFTVLLLLMVLQLSAQHKIGVRAGLNFSTFTGGELEQGEEYSISNGFHFGVNYTYSIMPNFGVRGEILYVQRGTRYNFVDTLDGVYNVIRPRTEPEFIEIGKKIEVIDISNGYISIPLTAQFQLTPKFEIFGGISLDLLLNPTGRGSLDFESDNFFFIQSYDFRYRGDEAGEVPFRIGGVRAPTVGIEVNEEQIDLWQTQSAYYKLSASEKVGNKFNFLDSHLIFGVNYFLNTGFYIGVRGQYGLTDITNNAMDFSVRELNDDDSYILRNDKDRSVSASVSFGFRF